jgi:ParB-like chromosome segregation protein Spo0J
MAFFFEEPMPNVQVREVRPGSIWANPANVRNHPKKQINLIARSIEQFGFVVPIVVDENNIILSGHARWLAAKLIGLRTVPVIELFGLSDAEKRAYMLAGNKLAEKAGWDRAPLAAELSDLASHLAEAGIASIPSANVPTNCRK